MLRAGSTLLSVWSGISFLLASPILASVVVFKANSPLLGMGVGAVRTALTGYSAFKRQTYQLLPPA